MKTSPFFVLTLLLTLASCPLAPRQTAFGAEDNRERNKGNRQNQARPPQGQRPASQNGNAPRGPAAAAQGTRNPSNAARQPNARPNTPRPNQTQNTRPQQSQNNRPENRPGATPQRPNQAKPEARPTPKMQDRPENRPAPKAANKPENRPAPKAANKPETRPAPKTPNKPEARPGGKGPNQAEGRPGGKGPNKPEARPGGKGPNQPEGRPSPKGVNKPDHRPGGKGANPSDHRPGGKGQANNNNKRPAPRPPAHAEKRAGKDNKGPGDKSKQANRPGGPHHAFVPGKVTRPGKGGNRPGANNSPQKRPINHPNRISKQRPASLNHVVKQRNTTNNWGNQWTNNNTTIWNNNRTTYRGPVVINQNFQNSVNYAYRPSSWGARPWWSSSTYHDWHHGSWNYGWNDSWHSYHRPVNYYHPVYLPGYQPYVAPRPIVPWGIAAWSLGSLYYDSGYSSYSNPYEAPPVQTRTTIINYSQPLSVVASQEVPEPQEAALTSEEMSTAALERARDAFSNGDYLTALKATDESISYPPGDPALHEFRALSLFALGRYGDAAGVLNPVLASGPGWDWDTMSDFYGDGEIYTEQLRKLEAYVESEPDTADSHFLLGYHYLVAGYVDEAYDMFDTVTTLEPADRVAVQLRNLTGSSSPTASPEGAEEAAPAEASEEPPLSAELGDGAIVEPLSPNDLIGGWKAISGNGKAITLTLSADGPFVWDYEGAADGKVLSGEWSIDEEGQLVLAAEDVQMVAEISLDEDLLQFILAGSPVGDPGLSFQRLP